MRILMLLENEFPFDERVEKEACTLIDNGHEVTLACCTRKQRAFSEVYKGIRIRRVGITKILYKLSAASLLFPFYFWFWTKFIKKLLVEQEYDAIHVHDLPLTKVAYLVCKKYNLKLICDQHEYYSNWIVHTAHLNTGLGKIVNYFSNWVLYEKKYLSKADLVITVEAPLKEIYIKEVGIDNAKLIVVPNTPLRKVYEEATPNAMVREKYPDSFILFYAGGIDSLRGLDLVLKAIRLAKKDIPDIVFLIAGVEQKGYSITKLAQEYDVSECVKFLGWVPGDQLGSYMAASSVGIFTPLLNRSEIHNTIATKIYQYCASGLPVIITKAKMMEEFVIRNQVGYAIENEVDFAVVLVKIHSSKSLQNSFKINCKEAASAYFWEHTSFDLINGYKKLENLREHKQE